MPNVSPELSSDSLNIPVIHQTAQLTDSKWSLITVAMFANFGGLVMGTAIGLTGPELNKVSREGI